MDDLTRVPELPCSMTRMKETSSWNDEDAEIEFLGVCYHLYI
jgi:hypothetical protein